MRKKKQEYVQLDIMSAFKGKDVVFKEEKEQEIKITKMTPFDISKDILKFKTGKCLDTEEGKKAFVPFIILKSLSMNAELCPMLNGIQQYVQVLSKEQLYQLLLHAVPRDTRYHQYIQTKEEEIHQELAIIQKFFECSKREAQEYVKIMGDEWAKKFITKCGDFSYEQ